MDGTLNFSDLIKKKYLEDMGGLGNLSINVGRILLALLLALALGFLIYYVYKKTFQGVVYSRSFNFSLVLTAMVTALVILPITSNLMLSLGMVGALSIVRFRAAIKEPLDIGYMFWAISVGITTGAGFYTLSIVGSLIIAVVIIAFSYIRGNNAEVYLLVLNYEDKTQNNVEDMLKNLPGKRLKTKTIVKGSIEATWEVRVKNGDTSFVQEISELEGVSNATLVSYNGDC
jgi:ABC-type Fe3+ transport system permease subunit